MTGRPTATCAVLALALFSVAPAVAQEAPTTQATAQPATRPDAPLDPVLAALLDRLGAPAFAERKAAQRELLAQALEHPEWIGAIAAAAESHVNPEIRSRCRLIAADLRDRERYGPSRLTLHVDGTAEQLIEAFIAEVDRISTPPGEAPSGQRRIHFWPEDEDPFQRDDAMRNKRVSVHLDGASFWDALAAVGKATGLWPFDQQGGFVLSPHGMPLTDFPRSLASSDGPPVAALVALRGAQRHARREVQFAVGENGAIRAGDAGSDSSLSLQLQLLLEPKLTLASQQVEMTITSAVDASGNDLRHGEDPGQAWGGGEAAWAIQMNLPLDVRAGGEAGMIARLEGHVEVEAAARMGRMTIDVADVVSGLAREDSGDPAPDKPPVEEEDESVDDGRRLQWRAVDRAAQAETYELRLRRAALPDWSEQRQMFADRRRNAGRAEDAAEDADDTSAVMQVAFQVELSTPDAPGLAEDWNRMQALVQSLRLVDAKGREWGLNQQNQEYDPENGLLKLDVTYARWRDDIGPPARLVWSVPLETHRLRIPFAFENIPLPQAQ